MTNEQRIQLRLSEVRTKLNEIAGIDKLTDEHRSESQALQTEYADLEIRHRAAIVAAGETKAEDNTGEGAELRSLTQRPSLGAYLAAAASGQNVDGAEAELRDAFGIRDSATVPWAALAPRAPEDRAITPAPSTLPRQQDEILARVFPMSATAFLGVDMPRVAVGESSFPVLVDGQTPVTLGEGRDRRGGGGQL